MVDTSNTIYSDNDALEDRSGRKPKRSHKSKRSRIRDILHSIDPNDLEELIESDPDLLD